MSCREKKKLKERWTFDRFREIHTVPNGTVDSDGENPDIVIHAADYRLGIEITEICHAGGPGDASAMAAAGEREGVMHLLQQRLESIGVPAVDVSVHFNGPLQFRSGERRECANRIAGYIASTLPELGGVFTSSGTAWPIDKDLPAEVHAITVARYPCLTRSFCSAPDCRWIPSLQHGDFEGRVAEKSARVEVYRERCDQVWLVMCINTADLATAYCLEGFTPPKVLTTTFDRLFLFSVMESVTFPIECS